MTLTDAMYIGASGLNAHSDGLGIVGDNIANVSTIGYKRDRAEFSDMLGSQLGTTQFGGGVKIGANETLFDQGSITQTGNPLDVAIQGNGFFVVSGTHDGQTHDYYTRDGQFQLDSSGFIVDRSGLKLQGFGVDASGNRSGGQGDLQLGARQSPAIATTSAKTQLHLDSSAPVKGAAFDPADPANTSNYQTSETVFDSLGTAHHVDLYMRNDGGTPAQWEYHAMVDGGEIGGTAGTPTEIGTGTLAFDTNGQLTGSATGTLSAAFNNATASSITIDFTGTQQTAGDSAVTSLDVDGRAGGTLTDIKITSDGKVSGVFNNGQEQVLAQIGLATFHSENGLSRAGDGLFDATPSSGQATVDAAGLGGRGSVTQGALEQSNVDLSTELVTMISYQRAFEANSKVVTTADQMMQDVSNLVR